MYTHLGLGDLAAAHTDPTRAQLYDQLIDVIDEQRHQEPGSTIA